MVIPRDRVEEATRGISHAGGEHFTPKKTDLQGENQALSDELATVRLLVEAPLHVPLSRSQLISLSVTHTAKPVLPARQPVVPSVRVSPFL